ncbi:hypothetical protein SO802_000082 [Lithocarpus litseifolius]|uniref:DUF4283 domain-containing protein n=1 Tax=Lithocarpus litseifolius TaxID=425828 RepID=A0AAW2DU06_9ROSI
MYRVNRRQISGKEFTLAAKFLTKRTLIVEAVARTFSPLWKSQNDFHIKDTSNNILLFVFESDANAVPILVNEPWSFDQHLVLLQRYEDNTPIRDLIFFFAVFWVQLHNLPVKMMDAPTTIGNGKTLGTVIELHDVSSIFGEDFMHIRINIDTTQPLCKVQKLNLGQGKIGWISFKYKKLPNFCYWMLEPPVVQVAPSSTDKESHINPENLVPPSLASSDILSLSITTPQESTSTTSSRDVIIVQEDLAEESFALSTYRPETKKWKRLA